MHPHDAIIRQKALHAIRAITAGALLFAGLGCSQTEPPEAALGDAGRTSATDASRLDAQAADAAAIPADAARVDAHMADATLPDAGAPDAQTITADAAPQDEGDARGADDADVAHGADAQLADAALADASVACKAEASDGICPADCAMHEDQDCCEAQGGIWTGGCAIPGPFVPPAMPA